MRKQMKRASKKPICCICHRPIDGYPHNAAPLADGVCCGKCNAEKVIPYRIELSGIVIDRTNLNTK